MIYYRQNVDSLAGIFDNYSVVILLGENYKTLQRDAKNISDEIAGPAAENEMRIKKYFNQEINGKKDEIISCLKTKSFFTGRQIIMLNDLSEKDYKIITDMLFLACCVPCCLGECLTFDVFRNRFCISTPSVPTRACPISPHCAVYF